MAGCDKNDGRFAHNDPADPVTVRSIAQPPNSGLRAASCELHRQTGKCSQPGDYQKQRGIAVVVMDALNTPDIGAGVAMLGLGLAALALASFTVNGIARAIESPTGEERSQRWRR